MGKKPYVKPTIEITKLSWKDKLITELLIENIELRKQIQCVLSKK